jgi:uncharacterized membrane protein
MLLALVVSVVAEGASPVTPLAGTDVAAIVPVPVVASEAPDPINRAALVFVPPAKEGKALLIHGKPASTMFPFASHLAQLLLTPAVLPVRYFEPLPRALLVVTALLGRRAADKVPLAMLLALVVSMVAEGASPVTPLAGTDVAVIVPVPVVASEAPDPITRAALVFVPPAKEGKALLIHGRPASTMFPFASHLAQLLLTPSEVTVAYFEPVPAALLVVTALLGRRAADKVPLAMLLALVVSMVAEGASPVTPLAGTDVAAIVPVPVVASEAPDPINRAALVFVPPAKEGKALLIHGKPASTIFPFASHLAQLLLAPRDVTVAYFEPVPAALLVVTALLGRRAADKVPLAMLLALVVSVVAEGASPVTPLAGTDVAAIVPVPVVASEAPDPIRRAALVFVPPAKEGKVPLAHGKPASIMFPFASHLAQLLLTPAVFPVAYFEPLPRALLVVTTLAGRRAADKVPLTMLLALVVSVVAEGASPVTPLAGTDVAAIVPVPVDESDAPEPMTMAALVFVPPTKEGKVLAPVVPVPQGAPASIILPFASHLAQLLLTPAAVEETVLLPVPVKLRID